MNNSLRRIVRVWLAILVFGSSLAVASAAVTVIGTLYKQDNMHPEFNCIWNSAGYPGSCASNFAGAMVHVYLRNDGASAVNVTNATLAGYLLKDIIKLRTQGQNDPYSIYYYWDDPPTAIFNAGEPVWWRFDPTNIPPGKVFQVAVRLRLVPTTVPVALGVMTDAGTVTTNITVDANAPQLVSVGFVPTSSDPVVKSSVNKVYLHWRRPGGTAPTSVFMDGTNVTSLGATLTTVNDAGTNYGVSLVTFTNGSLAYMSYHVFEGRYADGKKAAASLRTWVNRFNYGTYGACPTVTQNDGKKWIDDCQARGVNLLIWNNGSDGLTDLLNTANGQTYAKEREYDFLVDFVSKWNSTDPMGWYLRDEPDAHDNHITREDNDTPPNLYLPENDQHNVGVLAMTEINVGNDLHYRQGEITPTVVNINTTYKPANYFTYPQIADIGMSDPYYNMRQADAYWNNPQNIPLYQKPFPYIYAIAQGLTEGSEPNSSLVAMNTTGDFPGVTNGLWWPFMSAEVMRMQNYYAIAGGCKNLGYWWMNSGFGEGINTNYAPCVSLWKGIGLTGNEFKTLQPLIVASHPAPLPISTSTTNLWARGSLAGMDSLILVVMNDRYTNDINGMHFSPISNTTVTVTLPSWFNGSATSFEVSENARGVQTVSGTLSGNNLTLSLGTVNLTRLIVVTTNASLQASIARRYLERSYQGVCSFAPEHCQVQTTCVLNPGAEEGFRLLGGGNIANNWQEWEGPYGTNITGYDETTIKRTGGHSQRIKAQIPNGGSGGLYQRIPAVPGSNYTIGVWMYAGDGATKCYLGVDPKGGTDGNSTNVAWSALYTNQAWAQKTWTGNAVSNFMTVFYKVTTVTGIRNGYFDDATPACSSPTITQNPVATNTCAGGNVTFTVAASGPGAVSYQWQKNGINLTSVGHYSGTTAATLTVSSVDGNDVASYGCVVTTPYGAVPSSTAALTLKAATTITLQPTNQSVCTGLNATFVVAATGEGTITYQWQTNGVNISNNSHYGGATSATLTVTNVTSVDGVNYRCVVTAGCGSSTSFQGLLTVRPPTSITGQPSAQNICPGANTSFSVTATGDGTVSYQWQTNSVNISNGSHYSGCTAATLWVTNVQSADAVNYRCVVTAGCGSVNSSTAALTLKAATVITGQPTPQNLCAGGNATFSVSATGDGTLTYQWQTNSVNISNNSHYGGATSATLTVTNITAADAVNYRCVVTAGCGSANSSTALLSVCDPGTVFNHGNMEDASSYTVCPGWASYSAGPGTASWAKETVTIHGGAASQKCRNQNGGNGSLLGVRQNMAANVGDAFTMDGWVNPVSNPGAGQQVAMVAMWNGSTANPATNAGTWVISTGSKNVWTHLQNLAGNATSNSVTLFLDSRRTTSSQDLTAFWDDVTVYRAIVPPAPVVTAATSTSLNVDMQPGCNSTNSAAQYAISIGGGAYTLGTHWVQANGTVSTTVVWQSDATWGNKTVTGLSTGILYTFKVQARYSSSVTQPTSLGAGASGTP